MTNDSEQEKLLARVAAAARDTARNDPIHNFPESPSILQTRRIVAATLASGILASHPSPPTPEEAADMFDKMLAEMERRRLAKDGK